MFPKHDLEEVFHTIVIGGGQAGLAAGYFLSKQGENFVILDQNERTGDSWRKRWKSLRLFTPSQFDSLPGLSYSKTINYLPSKDEIADYLEEYARHFHLPIRHSSKVESLRYNDDDYEILTGSTRFRAKNVIVATGPFQTPFIPGFSEQLDKRIIQMHSASYHDTSQFPVNKVLVVGAGNSGAEIALELANNGKEVWLAGRDVGRVPANSPLGKVFNGHLIWWIMTHLLTVDTPIGKKIQAEGNHHGTPLGRATRNEVASSGVKLSPKVADIQDGFPKLEDGQILDVEGVLWATGYRPYFEWIKLPIFDENEYPIHSRGVVKDTPGLYFLGLLFQSGLSSSLLGGVGKDAAYITSKISR
ncbi:MAG: hypothetical protein CVU46_04315 [Chloroflexi bacterium HGW-Chloroflexi-8]|nr:MAG: hypothetical protein CVU46_04315 [Chloroflexi bacterium HGW-Chloroflexi-8]